jgi:hypothetical protein
MMKILTQKMLGAQGWGALCQNFVISREAKNLLLRAEAALPNRSEQPLLAFACRNDNRSLEAA